MRLTMVTIAAAVLGLAGCRSQPAPTGVTHLLAPAGTDSTAGLPRVELGTESRPVLGAHPVVVLRRDDAFALPSDGALALDAELPPAMAASAVLVDGVVSIRDPAFPVRSLADLRAGGRVEVRAASHVLGGPGGERRARLEFALAAGMQGRTGRLVIFARPLGDGPIERDATAPVFVPRGSRLDFGYGVEEAGWRHGMPPVVFRVRAEPEGAGNGSTTLFERRIDPAGDARDRRWFDASVALDAVAGRSVRLVFEREALAAPGVTLPRSFGVVSAPEVVAPAPGGRRRPNVVLVSLDTLRARSVGAYGAPEPTTPAFDARVAAAGALVRQAVTPDPFTPPAHMSMLTGLAPCAHGVLTLDTTLAPDRVTLAERFRAAGYRTAAVTEDAYVHDGAGFERGFDEFIENRSEEDATPGFAAETFAAAREWIRARGDRPFFLFVHTYQVHEPYTPPRGYEALFGPPPVGASAQAARRYAQEIRYTDDVLADFLDALDACGREDDTILVVTSDHGEAFGEHAVSGHGWDLHDEALLVPLAVRAPGRVPAGRIIEGPVDLIDLAPTLLDLAGLAPLPDVQGRSFAGLLTGRDAHAFVEQPIVSRAFADALTPIAVSVRTATYKYIKRYDTPREAFYDLTTDPEERRSLTVAVADSPASVHLREARQLVAEADARCASWRKAHPARPAPAALGAPGWLVNRELLEERDAVERKLRSLGYVE
ncbi:MAG TPA: sulfatase [Candidatus Binatia bacterium]|nr:sulfatase [Candidatus Binatia bacterium]